MKYVMTMIVMCTLTTTYVFVGLVGSETIFGGPTKKQPNMECVQKVDLDKLSQTVVSISVRQSDGRVSVGTAWYVGNNQFVTARQVFEDETTDEPHDLLIDYDDWGSEVTFSRSTSVVEDVPNIKITTPVWLLEITEFGDKSEAVLMFKVPSLVTDELGIQTAHTADRILKDGDTVLSIGYSSEMEGGYQSLRFVVGTNNPPKSTNETSFSSQATTLPYGMLWLEMTAVASQSSMKMTDEKNILRYGSSGAPVFNCAGRVVGVITNHVVKEEWSTNVWGSPTNIALPLPLLLGSLD